MTSPLGRSAWRSLEALRNRHDGLVAYLQGWDLSAEQASPRALLAYLSRPVRVAFQGDHYAIHFRSI